MNTPELFFIIFIKILFGLVWLIALKIWPYYSFRKGFPGICNIELGRSLIDLPDNEDQFYRDTVSSLDAGLETVIF